MRDCERCINAKPYGGPEDNRCSAWSCEFIDRAEAIKIYNEYKSGGLIVKDKAVMILEDRLQLTAREDESISKSARLSLLRDLTDRLTALKEEEE